MREGRRGFWAGLGLGLCFGFFLVVLWKEGGEGRLSVFSWESSGGGLFRDWWIVVKIICFVE